MNDPMSDSLEPPQGEPDPIASWILIPLALPADERSIWARNAADAAVTSLGLDTSYGSDLAHRLEVMASADIAQPASWRLAHLEDPEVGISAWDLAFLEGLSDVAASALLGPVTDGQLGGESIAFTSHEIEGWQRLRFDIAVNEGAIEGFAATTVTRELAGRVTTLLAACRTTRLESLVASLLPVQYLLTSPDLEEWVAAASD